MPDRTTRLIVPTVVITGATVVAIGLNWPAQEPAAMTPGTPAPPSAPSSATTAQPTLGLVRIDYDLERRPGHASNQVAVWIETADGEHVRSLFATSFTAEGGYQRRPESLSAWRDSADWDASDLARVETVARPAQDSGMQSVYWDGLDETGAPVPPGEYRFLVEGNLLWENRVLFTGTITISEQPAKAEAEPEYLPAGAEDHAGMIEGVRAEFLPGRPLEPDMITAYTRGS